MNSPLRALCITVALTIPADLADAQSPAVTLPPGFAVTEVAAGLSQTIAMAIAPDGRIFVCEKVGRLRVIRNGVLQATPVLTVPVPPPGPSGSNGLLGVALDPQFQSNGLIYIHRTVPGVGGSPARNRISRYRVTNDIADPASETVLLELHEESETGHYGGDLKFGPDGMLYVLVGMHDSPESAQTLTDFKGKVLRMTPNGGVPADNPFAGAATLAGRLTWAMGLRNPFTFDFDRTSGRLFINDVGQVTFEEINEGHAGANFGWPESEGPTTNPAHTSPFHYYGRNQGCALTAGAFYDVATPRFPAPYAGRYFFADWCEGWIRAINPGNAADVLPFATGTSFPMDFEVGPGGGLYYIEWQNDKVFRITYGGWSGANVGAVGAAGSFTQDGTTLTVRGSGADIWGTADEFFYVSQAVTGDFDFTARAASVQNVDQWTKAGLMLRTGLGAGAVHASVFATPTTAKGVAFQRRTTTGGASVHTSGPAAAPPVWLRLVREGNIVTAYSRPSLSVPWSPIGTQSLAGLPATVHVGIAVTSHLDGTLATAVFDNVSIVAGGTTNVAPTVTLTAPADGATFSAPAIVAMTANASDPDDGVNRVEFQVESGGSWTTVDQDASAPYQGQASLTEPGTYRLRARGVDASGAEGLSAAVTVTVTPASTSWQGSDVGSVGASGSSTVGDTTATVTGAGADIWGTADAFHFAHQPVSGDFEITARVTSVQNVNAWTKAGLMIREGLTAGARHASIFATPTTLKGVAFQRRPTAGGLTVHTAGAPEAPPGWLKLTRRGDRIHAYYRKTITDPWALVGDQVISGLAAVLDVGFAVSSHVHGTPATATFADIRLAPLPEWVGVTIGGASGSASFDSVLFSVAGGGADVWNTADAFLYLYAPMSGDGSITARVKSLEHVHDWSKAGVMIRESEAAGSKHAFALVSAARGATLQYRTATGGTSAGGAIVSGAAPGWVRLVRSGNTFTASWSVNGTTWVPLGSTTIAMGAEVLAGLAVTSHDASTVAEATFDDVVVER